MRQIKLGNWPAMPLAAAVVEWEVKRNIRDTGEDPAHTRRRARARVAGSDAQHVPGAYTVRRLVADYLAAHVEHNVYPAAQTNTRYAPGTPIEPILDTLPETVTRKMAFDLLERLRDRPTWANHITMELGAAWDNALDAGRFPENTPNWCRQTMRGRLRSKGHSRNGERITDKRVLTDPEIAVLVP